jgi:hypothetical protein
MYNLDKGLQDSDFVFLRKSDLGKKVRDHVKAALEKDRYGVFARRKDFVLLKRGHDPSANAELKRDWRL